MSRGLSIPFLAIMVATSVVRLLGQGQADEKALTFEVASIKPNSADAVGVGGVGWGPDSLRARNQSPASLLRMAFGAQADQIIDAPTWAATERFDISAKVAPGVVFIAMTMLQPMLRHLLEDRFQLRFTTKPVSSTYIASCASVPTDSARSSLAQRRMSARRRIKTTPSR